MYDAKKRVGLGVEYLDRTNPDWAMQSELDGEISVGNEQSCVLARLGQTKYRTARNLRNLTNEEAAELGFYARNSKQPDGSLTLHEYAALSIEWMRRRDERRAQVERLEQYAA